MNPVRQRRGYDNRVFTLPIVRQGVAAFRGGHDALQMLGNNAQRHC